MFFGLNGDAFGTHEHNMGYKSELPAKDSAASRGIKTALQALFTFVVGLLVVIYQVPGVPETIINYTWQHLPDVLLSVGIPMTIGTGLVSFLYNVIFRRRDVQVY